MIASGCGGNESLKKIREFYVNGHATKDDIMQKLCGHTKSILLMGSRVLRGTMLLYSTMVCIVIFDESQSRGNTIGIF